MIKLKGFKRALVDFIYFFGLVITIGIPFGYLTYKIKQNISIDQASVTNIAGALYAVVALALVAIIYSVWLKQWVKDKVLAIRIRNELGMFSSTPVVISRTLMTLTYSYLFVISLLIFYVFKLVFLQYPIFVTLYNLNFMFLGILGFGAVIMLVGDIVKIWMMNLQEIDDKLNKDMKEEELKLKKLGRNNAKMKRYLLAQNRIDDIKTGMREEVEAPATPTEEITPQQ